MKNLRTEEEPLKSRQSYIARRNMKEYINYNRKFLMGFALSFIRRGSMKGVA